MFKGFLSKTLIVGGMLGGLLMFSGCETTGAIQGVSNGKPVRFDYTQGMFDNDGLISITMPDGEVFSGKFVQKTSSTSGTDLEIGESSDDDGIVLRDSTTTSSLTEAVLIGNRGGTMKCRFQLSDPDMGMDGGGIGTCKTSKGEDVNVTF